MPSVPITPTRRPDDAASALSAPGSTAPITGTGLAAISAGSAWAEAVLQAISTSFTSCASRNCKQVSE